MKNRSSATIQRGQAITFRVPSDTPDHILKQLQKLKETERRNFSSTIAEFALDGIKNSLVKERESITIPLPKPLTKEQRNWLRHAHSETLIGTIVYQLLEDPVRVTSLFASLNSQAVDIDEALYLQEQVHSDKRDRANHQTKEIDDLDEFDLNQAREQLAISRDEQEEVEEDAVELLGDFITKMNQ